MPQAKPSDAELVTGSLGGNRDAFRQIVERYKTLVCSVAYCATGNVSQSEDLAQETFITAWGSLRLLREPEKLRSWLCGITRHRTQKYWYRTGRQPIHHAAPLEDAHNAPAPEPLPSDQTITRDEEAIMWRSLARIPGIYREPLILFYREHQSVEHVAAALELSEDAVKQRLSRGRKLLQEEVQAFVEGALQRTAPKPAFAHAVFAALPLATWPAAAAGWGGAVAKGTAATKAGILTAWLAPLIGSFGGFAAQWLVIRTTTVDRGLQTRKMRELIVTWILLVGIAVGGEFAVESLARHYGWSDWVGFAVTAGFWWLYACALATWIITMVRRILARCAEEGTSGEIPPVAMKPGAYIAMVAGVYLSLGSWLVRLAWLAHDRLSVGIIGVTMVGLGVWHCCHVLRRTGMPGARVSLGHTALAAGMVVLIFNFRFGAWVAFAHGVSVAEIHSLRPMWMIPAFTFAFFVWVGVVLALTNRKSGFR